MRLLGFSVLKSSCGAVTAAPLPVFISGSPEPHLAFARAPLAFEERDLKYPALV